MGTGVPPSNRIVTQIASAEGLSPTDLEPPLHDIVDPDALDRLIESNSRRSSDAELSLEFTYRGHTVHVDATGAVDVSPPERPADSSSNVESTEDAAGD